MTKIYCWDTTLFIALMNEEPGTPFDVIDVISDELENGKAVLLIPSVVFAEIWEAKHSPSALELINNYLKNKRGWVVNNEGIILISFSFANMTQENIEKLKKTLLGKDV